MVVGGKYRIYYRKITGLRMDGNHVYGALFVGYADTLKESEALRVQYVQRRRVPISDVIIEEVAEWL